MSETVTVEAFSKVLTPCKTDDGTMWVTVKWTDERLSIVGVEGPRSDGNARGSCGQNRDALTGDYVVTPGWSRDMVARLAEIWDRWHLNDMRAGCEHQRAAGWKATDMVGVACEMCGYRFGTAWLSEDVPAKVLAELLAMPSATRDHPWGDVDTTTR